MKSVYIGVCAILVTTALLSILYLIQNNGLKNRTGLTGASAVSSSNGKPTFLVVGPCSGGKTSFLYRLRSMNKKEKEEEDDVEEKSKNKVDETNELPFTVTSQTPFELMNYTFQESNKKCNFIDFPGHIKVRYQLESYIRGNKNLKGVIFVMDSTDNGDKLDNTVEFLFEIINFTEKYHDGVDILIACNKTDLFASRPGNKVKDQLQIKLKELIVRKKKSVATKNSSANSSAKSKFTTAGRSAGNKISPSAGDDEDADEQYVEHLINPNFTFADLDGSFDSIGGSVLKNKIDSWTEWVQERL